MHITPRAACAVLASAALALGTAGVVATAGSANAAGRHTLPGSVPAWANAAHHAHASDPGTKVTFRVYQHWRHGDAARQFALSASTPGSGHYADFLTPAQFRQRYAPSPAATNTLEKWLRDQGFKVTGVPANRKYVQATGTLRQAASTFDTAFAQYRVDGSTLRSNTRPLSVPSSISDEVQAVVGLDQSQMLAQPTKPSPPPAVFVNARPCSTYWAEKTVDDSPALDGTDLPDSPNYAWAPCGYAGKQLQGAYGMLSAIGHGNDGSGVTVGVIDAFASPTIESDVETYSAKHGLPSIKGHFRQVVPPGIYQHPNNPVKSPSGWAGEETLDIEAVHTMAPGADIVYIGAPNANRDLDAIMNQVVDNHLADIVTNSYGYAGEALPPGYIQPQLDTQVQAAAEGISLLFSSGDSGDETGGNPDVAPTPDWPASSPLVTAVGGTSLGVSKDNSRVFELGWQTGHEALTDEGTWGDPAYQYGGGGGTSRLFAQPSYQQGVVPSSMSQTYGGQAMRVVPDVSALGDPTTGMLVGETQTWPDGHTDYGEYRLGGTSLSSPLYAGMLALAAQKAGHPFGLANPVLYQARSSSIDITKDAQAQYPGAVRPDYVNGVDDTDGYTYSVRLFDFDAPLTIHVRDGYDDVTGVGVPNGSDWLAAVAGH